MRVPVRVVLCASLLMACGEVQEPPSEAPGGADSSSPSPSPGGPHPSSEPAAPAEAPTSHPATSDGEEHTGGPTPSLTPPKDLPATPETDKPDDREP